MSAQPPSRPTAAAAGSPGHAAMEKPRRADLLTPRELAALGGLEFVARQVVEGFIAGLHRSPHRGFSVEFAEHRMYQPGDDLRYIDWRMYGRSDRYYIKQFEEETNLRAYLLLDVSASMAWTSAEKDLPPKLWYARQLAACLALLLARQGDAVGLLTFDSALRSHVAPRGGRRHWHELVRAMLATDAGGGTDPGAALRDLAGRLRRRGLVILISDLLVDPDATRLALRFLRHRGHEVLVFHLLDPGERELPALGDARFVDPETGEEVPASVADLRREYREAVQRAVAEWRAELAPQGIDYVLTGTEEPLTHSLRAYLRKRERLG
ncbi:MAG TPA: DUF58 domain-containing protein [Longimicrobiales bacterium]|nr:DUF58 domain-containing protein [Longimicrobiales bacterium]